MSVRLARSWAHILPLQIGGLGRRCEELFERRRRKPNLANRVDEAVEQVVIKSATDFPAYGQAWTSNELRKLGVFVSPSGVRSIWLRHDLANFKNRLKALEAKVAEEGTILTEVQVQALEKTKHDELGGQDTFYVGTYSKIAHAKLYTTKTPITAADLLNDRMLPFHEEHDLPVLRIMTNRGREYCGGVGKHDFQPFLGINDIDHTKTKVKSPQTSGICERFLKTILQEFYQITFRKKLYDTIDAIQTDLDARLHHHNHERTHQGKSS